MLADWYKKEIIKEAEERGFRRGYAEGFAEVYAKGCPEKYAEGLAIGKQLVLEAENWRLQGETLQQALDRLLAVKANRR